MHHVGILKAAHHMDDRVHLPDMAQKLVSETFSFRSPLYQPGNVYKFDYRRGYFLRVVHISQEL